MSPLSILVFCIVVLPFQAREEAMEQGTCKDGKRDLWKGYDKSESLVKGSRDVNLDGKLDALEEVNP